MSDNREPCCCEACDLAGCDRPPITIPAFKGTPARTLHGKELVAHYRAQDELRATLAKLRGSMIERAVSKVLPEVKP